MTRLDILKAKRTSFHWMVWLTIICLPIIVLVIIIWLIVKAAKGDFKHKKTT